MLLKVITGMLSRPWQRRHLKCYKLEIWMKETLWTLLRVWLLEWGLIVIFSLTKNFKRNSLLKSMEIMINIIKILLMLTKLKRMLRHMTCSLKIILEWCNSFHQNPIKKLKQSLRIQWRNLFKMRVSLLKSSQSHCLNGKAISSTTLVNMKELIRSRSSSKTALILNQHTTVDFLQWPKSSFIRTTKAVWLKKT